MGELPAGTPAPRAQPRRPRPPRHLSAPLQSANTAIQMVSGLLPPPARPPEGQRDSLRDLCFSASWMSGRTEGSGALVQRRWRQIQPDKCVEDTWEDEDEDDWIF